MTTGLFSSRHNEGSKLYQRQLSRGKSPGEPKPRDRGFNRTDAARALLAEIEAWSKGSHPLESKLGLILYRHPGFVGNLRKRLCVTPEKEADVRKFIAEHPDGVEGIAVPNMHLKLPKPSVAEAQLRKREAASDVCGKCGDTRPDPCAYPTCPKRGAS